MKLVIQKFGGTSLANIKLIKNAALRINDEIVKGNKVVAVASAMAGTTNDLLELCNRMSNKGDDLAKAEIDSIASTGEQVSAGLLAMALQNLGYKAQSVLGWQVKIETDNNYGNASIKNFSAQYLNQLLANDIIPIIAGFQGVDFNNRITTLGRGSSDYTAVLVAAHLKASRCDIYTDVDGVYNVDPKIIDKAKKIHNISYEEMYEMASLGSKVLHPSAVRCAQEFKVPVKILSSFSPNQESTLVCSSSKHNSASISGLTYQKINDNLYIVSIIGTDVEKNDNFLSKIHLLINKVVKNQFELSISKYSISITINTNNIKPIIKSLYEAIYEHAEQY